MKSYSFYAALEIIGINPYVQVPEAILTEIFNHAGKKKGVVRYISSLKTEESRDRNIQRAIHFLLRKSSFIGKKTL